MGVLQNLICRGWARKTLIVFLVTFLAPSAKADFSSTWRLIKDRFCELTLVSQPRPVEVNGFSQEQTVIIHNNLITQRLKDSGIGRGIFSNAHYKSGIARHVEESLSDVFNNFRKPGYLDYIRQRDFLFYRGLQIRPSDLRRILDHGMQIRDPLKPSLHKGLYVAPDFESAAAYSQRRGLHNANIYRTEYLSVVFEMSIPGRLISSSYLGYPAQEILNDIPASSIKRVWLLNKAFLESGEGSPYLELPIEGK